MVTSRPHRRRVVAVVAVVAAVVTGVGATPAGGSTAPSPAGAAVDYRPPVDGEIIDPFRPPTHPYGAGNAGVDYRTPPGTQVRAAASGVVVFAGLVAGSHHVVVLHADGLRTTYAFLDSTLVARGQRLAAGDPVGRSGGSLHFGVRAGDEYLDPVSLWSGPPTVVLVPLEHRRAGSVAAERRGLLRSLTAWAGRGARAVGGAAVDVAGLVGEAVSSEVVARLADLRLALRYLHDLEPTGRFVAAMSAVVATLRAACTPAGARMPRLAERRIAVLVGGLGASADRAAIRGLDLDSLGYRPGDVAQLSYRGGAVPGVGALGIAGRSYEAADTSGDLRQSAAALRDLLTEIRLRHPGVPVDVIAHSQGGIVTRLALDEDDHRDPRLPSIATVVTLGSPHRGADLATAVAGLSGTWSGMAAVAVADASSKAADAVLGVSTAQLAEGSSVIADLEQRRLPEGTFAASIGARGDLVVPLPATRWDGATHATVDLTGAGAHGDLVESSAAQRELALALAHQPPTCVGVGTAVADAAIGEAISFVTDAAGAAINVGARVADARITRPTTRRAP